MFSRNSLLALLILIILSFFSIKTILIRGYFPMHDDTQPSRVYEMGNALKDGMFPVRWSENLGYGYGYPIFNFYAPFAYYIGAFFNIVGFDAISATKIMMGIAMVLAGIFMYYLAREFWGEEGGLISGLLYVYAPYHALNLYVRGDVSELYAYSFIPLVFLSVYKLYRNVIKESKTQLPKLQLDLVNNNLKLIWISVSSLSYALLIISHNLTALMVTPFLLIAFLCISISLYKLKKLKNLLIFLLVFILGIAMSAFYWLPALSEMHYTNVLSQIGGKADYKLHFVCLQQFWDSPWLFGGSAPGCIDGMSFMIGKLHIFLALTAVIIILILRKRERKHTYIILSTILLIAATVFLMTDSAKFFWDLIPIMKFFQYPWRFLIMTTFLMSFLAGSIIWSLESLFNNLYAFKLINIFVTILITLSILVVYKNLFNPQTINAKTDSDYTSDIALKWKISRISDEYLPGNFTKPTDINDFVKSKITIISGQGQIVNESLSTNKQKFEIAAVDSPLVLGLKTAYFPAWKLYLNGTKADYKISDKGMVIGVPQGKNTLDLLYEETIIEKTGNLITLSGIAVLCIGIIGSNIYRALKRH